VKLFVMLWDIVTFSQSIRFDLSFNRRLSVDMRWVVLVQVTVNAHLYGWRLYEP